MTRLHDKARRDALRADFDRRVARALGEAVGTQRVVVTPTGADALRLRGIPAIGRGVAGHVIGTQPEREALR
jgi:hypothetical protein